MIQLPRLPAQLPKTQQDWSAFLTAMQQWQTLLQGDSWTATTLLNSWAYDGAPFNPIGYRMDITGRVWMRGMLTAGTSGTVAFTLPYAPAYQQQLPGICALGGIYGSGAIVVHTNGDVLPFYNSGTLNWISLDGLSFSLSP